MREQTRREFMSVITAGLGLAAASAGVSSLLPGCSGVGQAPGGGAGSPNIIFILADDLGYLNQRHAHNYYPTYLWRNEEKVKLDNEVQDVNPPGGVATKRVQYSHDLFAEEALAFVERNKSKPFFLYLAFTIPHANNEAKDKGIRSSRTRTKTGPSRRRATPP